MLLLKILTFCIHRDALSFCLTFSYQGHIIHFKVTLANKENLLFYMCITKKCLYDICLPIKNEK